jgi:putative ATPase
MPSTAKVSQLRELVRCLQKIGKGDSGRQNPLGLRDEIYHFKQTTAKCAAPGRRARRSDTSLGTTVENPYFEINKTLLSRAYVLELRPLKAQELVELLCRALTDVERASANWGIERRAKR